MTVLCWKQGRKSGDIVPRREKVKGSTKYHTFQHRTLLLVSVSNTASTKSMILTDDHYGKKYRITPHVSI